MRLATFNVLHGRSTQDGRVDAARLRQAVADLDADVVGLQEVDRAQPRSHGLDLTEVAAGAYGPGASWRFAPTLVGTPGHRWSAAADHEDADGTTDPTYGIALVTRLPVHDWHVHRLAPVPTKAPVLVGGRKVIWVRDEPRAVLAAVVETPHGPMTVATTHLSFVPVWNAVQLVRVTRLLQHLPRPAVLLGDLNLPSPLPSVLTGWRTLADLPSFPAVGPRVQLDHVLGHGDLPPVVAAESRVMPLSDHRAVLVDLEGTGR